MHTESTITPAQAYIARHRVAIALTVAVLITLTITGGAALILPLMGIISGNMVTAIGVLSALGGGIAALATYWGVE